MIEKFKQIEKIIDCCDFFAFYEFDEFIESYNDESQYDFDCECDVEMYNDYMHCIDLLQNKYHCNNDNTIVLLSNCDHDEYLIINFEYNIRVLTQNIYFNENEINDKFANNALYDILYELFVDDLLNKKNENKK